MVTFTDGIFIGVALYATISILIDLYKDGKKPEDKI